MEEGLEPQEMLEHGVDQHHEAHADHAESQERQRDTRRSAIAAACLAVCAALGSLLSGHAANTAILDQTKASDQWAYYQAKSTKSHIYEGNQQLIATIAEFMGKADDQVLKKTRDSFDKQTEKFNQEKNEIQNKALELETESTAEFRKHQNFSIGIAFFQIGIVLASVSLIVRQKWLFTGCAIAGVVGLVFLVLGMIAS